MAMRKAIQGTVVVLLLAALTAWAFGAALNYGFVRYDDTGYVMENPMVLTGLSAANVRTAFTSVCHQWWLPMLWISYMVDTELYGTGAWGYHLTNLLLHAANAVLCFWFLYRLTGARGRSLAAAALWAVHPLRVESVVWITERKDVLSGLFFFLALLAYLHHVRRPGLRRMAVVFAGMLLGLMSKASVIVLPALLLLLDYWPLRRAEWPGTPGSWKRWGRLVWEKAGLFLLAAVFAVINLHTHTSGIGGEEGLPLLHRLALMPGNAWIYLRLVFWPAGLAFFYPENDRVAVLPLLAALAGLVVLLAVLIRQRRRRPWWTVGGLWFFIALLPVLRGIRLGFAAYADRFTYLPSIGLMLALVWGAAAALDGGSEGRPRLRRRLRAAAAVGAAGLVLALGGLARRQTETWRDSETLFRHALAVTEDNVAAHSNLANLLVSEGRRVEAVEHYEAVLALKPEHANTLNNLAWTLATDPAATPEQAAHAVDLAWRGIERIGGGSASRWDTLGVARAAAGDYAGAVEAAERAQALAVREGDPAQAGRIGGRLRLYREGRPYRE